MAAQERPMIPGLAHFIWLGSDMPWACVLAVRSALAFGGFDKAVLHCEPALQHSPAWAQLQAMDRLDIRFIDAEAILALPAMDGTSLNDIYAALTQPAARANVLRAAILYKEGGVYLDMDTITVRPLDALRASCGAFCGEEHIVWPGTAQQHRTPQKLAVAAVRKQLRRLMRHLPDGWRWFRYVERYYLHEVNNAVLGSAAGHAFIARLLHGMQTLPAAQRGVRYALGTHLLQHTVKERREADLCVLPPAAFYPLAPEISAHWFRHRRRLPALSEVVLPDTRVVHWYASVRTRDILPLIDEGYVRRHAATQLFSALACSVLDGTTPAIIDGKTR